MRVCARVCVCVCVCVCACVCMCVCVWRRGTVGGEMLARCCSFRPAVGQGGNTGAARTCHARPPARERQHCARAGVAVQTPCVWADCRVGCSLGAGIPIGTVNLLYGVPPGETTITSLAGAGTYLLEFGMLTRLTQDRRYEDAARGAMRVSRNRSRTLPSLPLSFAPRSLSRVHSAGLRGS